MKIPAQSNGREPAGKRLFGAVQYAVADEFVCAANCHCSNCRRAAGSAYKPFAGIERNRLRIIEGESNLMIYGNDGGCDTHCRVCGSLLFSVVRGGMFVHIALGTLADVPKLRPAKHNFVGSKAPWFTITDDLPQYQEHLSSARRDARP